MTTRREVLCHTIMVALDNAISNGYDMSGDPEEIAIEVLDQGSEIVDMMKGLGLFDDLDGRIRYVTEVVKSWQEEYRSGLGFHEGILKGEAK